MEPGVLPCKSHGDPSPAASTDQQLKVRTSERVVAGLVSSVCTSREIQSEMLLVREGKRLSVPQQTEARGCVRRPNDSWVRLHLGEKGVKWYQ